MLNQLSLKFSVVHVCSLPNSEQVAAQQTAFRQLESLLTFYRFTRSGRYSDALMELAKLNFLPLGTRTPESSAEALRYTSLHVQVIHHSSKIISVCKCFQVVKSLPFLNPQRSDCTKFGGMFSLNAYFYIISASPFFPPKPKLNKHVQACVPDLLREALTCLDQVNDADGTVRRLKSKVRFDLFIVLLS